MQCKEVCTAEFCLLLFCKTAVVFIPFFLLLHNNILRTILSAAMHEKQVTVNADMDHREILDVAAQQGVGEESGSDGGNLLECFECL